MAYFPDKQRTKVEIQESTTECDLSCTHLTTANFFELNVGYYRETTTREYFRSNQNIYARPVPMQAPVMGEAVLKLKNYFVPYRVVSPQWHDFITKSPHVSYNGDVPFIVQEMPYTTANEMVSFITNNLISTTTADLTSADFITDQGIGRKLTFFGRHAVKILNQLGYQIVMDAKCKEHFDMMPLLAFAKVYLDYYTTNQYSQVLESAYRVEALLKEDRQTAYLVTAQDLLRIFNLTNYVKYSPDYFTSNWDNPTTPNEVAITMGNITIKDITTNPDLNQVKTNVNTYDGTPYATIGDGNISQYTLDALKGLTDFCRRLQGSVKSIDRYLARFGVLLTAEKMQRSIYNGEQNTPMSFGAIYSTAETAQANVGDYAGQGMINGGTNTTFEFEELDEMGCILSLFSINPKIGYYQGIDRQHLLRNVESYFNGQWDNLGTQATSAAELYVSKDGRSIYGKQAQFDTIFGYLPRQAHYKVGKDRLTGDFVRPNIAAGSEAWHMFRTIDESDYDATENDMVHSPEFVSPDNDADQYNRIFNYQTAEGGDMFNVSLQYNIKARIHGKALYDDYDFEGEGKKIIMDGTGAKQN